MKNYKHLISYILLAILVTLSFSQTRSYSYNYLSNEFAKQSYVNKDIYLFWPETISMSSEEEVYTVIGKKVIVRYNSIEGVDYSYSCVHYFNVDIDHVVSVSMWDFANDSCEYWKIDTLKKMMTIRTKKGHIYLVTFSKNGFTSSRLK